MIAEDNIITFHVISVPYRVWSASGGKMPDPGQLMVTPGPIQKPQPGMAR